MYFKSVFARRKNYKEHILYIYFQYKEIIEVLTQYWQLIKELSKYLATINFRFEIKKYFMFVLFLFYKFSGYVYIYTYIFMYMKVYGKIQVLQGVSSAMSVCLHGVDIDVDKPLELDGCGLKTHNSEHY